MIIKFLLLILLILIAYLLFHHAIITGGNENMEYHELVNLVKQQKNNHKFWFTIKQSPRYNDEYLMLEWKRNVNYDKNLHLTIWKSIWNKGNGVFHLAGDLNGNKIKIWYRIHNGEIFDYNIADCQAANDKKDYGNRNDLKYQELANIWLDEFKKLFV